MRQVRETVYGVVPEWEYLPDGWSTKRDKIKGWHDPTIVETQKSKWVEFLRVAHGTGPLGIAFEAPSIETNDYYAHHILMAYAYVLALAARQKTRISLLDWGGGLGHYFIFSRMLVPDLDIDYWCKDLPSLCEAGQRVLPELRFVEDESVIVGRQYDLVIASGSLQYLKDWKSVAQLLASVASPYLYITRLPFVRRDKSFVALQRVHRYGYDTEVMGWVFSRDEFIDAMVSLGLELVREFAFDKHPMIKNVQEQAQIQGFLFRSKMASHP